MRRIKTLLACWDEATDTARAVLGTDFVLTVTHTISGAEKYLAREHFDLVVATIRFDESRPLDLLPLASQHAVPVALVRFGVSQLHSELVAAVFLAARTLGCKATLDLVDRSKVLGKEAAVAEFRIALRAAAHHVRRAA